MKRYIYALMKDERDGPIAGILKAVLSFASFFYSRVVDIMRFIKTRASKRLPCKVISVGNMTLGGTGKTPLTRMLAASLKKMGRSPAVLIRGYGEDEWKMLKDTLSGIPVIVGRDRIASGSEACAKLKADTVILDDGFQHWPLKRDLDIVLIDSTDPFGNGKVFPRGLLREGLKGLSRADIVLLTKTDMGKDNIERIMDELKSRIPHTPVAESIHHPTGIYELNRSGDLDLSSLQGERVFVFSSIVNSAYFEYTLKALGARIISALHYPDHYNYRAEDLERVFDEAKKLKIDTIVTTEKDAPKLRELKMPEEAARILILRVELKVTKAEEILNDRLHTLYSR
ncbi:MAG: tetraacyldisaccharide 4'-kinase [Candidatus Omnitrophota bacterium]